MKFLIPVVVFLLLAGASCTYNKEEELYGLACDTSNVRYSVEVKNILDANCVSCHNASNPGAGLNLNDYNVVKTSALNGCLIGSVKQISPCVPMPPITKLSSCQIQQLDNWVKSGAPNN